MTDVRDFPIHNIFTICVNVSLTVIKTLKHVTRKTKIEIPRMTCYYFLIMHVFTRSRLDSNGLLHPVFLIVETNQSDHFCFKKYDECSEMQNLQDMYVKEV